MKFREIVGVTFVLFGVCVEALFTIAIFVFDEGISRSQQTTISKQQDTIIGLETAQQTLTEEENKTKLAISAANERATLLEKEAADARLETAQIMQSAAWRELLPDQRSKLFGVLNSAPHKVTLEWIANDSESLSLATQLYDVLWRAKWNVMLSPGFLRGDVPLSVEILEAVVAH